MLEMWKSGESKPWEESGDTQAVRLEHNLPAPEAHNPSLWSTLLGRRAVHCGTGHIADCQKEAKTAVQHLEVKRESGAADLTKASDSFLAPVGQPFPIHHLESIVTSLSSLPTLDLERKVYRTSFKAAIGTQASRRDPHQLRDINKRKDLISPEGYGLENGLAWLASESGRRQETS